MLRVNQGEFAKALNVTQVTLSRWEHGRKHSRESDLLMRLVYIGCKDDEYTNAAHQRLWKLLSEKLPGLQSHDQSPNITIDPEQCDPKRWRTCWPSATPSLLLKARRERAPDYPSLLHNPRQNRADPGGVGDGRSRGSE